MKKLVSLLSATAMLVSAAAMPAGADFNAYSYDKETLILTATEI